MCLCVSACVCVMCIYIHVGTCVILINLDNYLYFAWKEHVYGKEQYFVFLIASLTKNQMWIKWILSLSLPVVNFQYKRTMQHWEQEYPIDRICWCTMGKMLYYSWKAHFLVSADALGEKCYTYSWKTHFLKDISLPFIRLLCSTNMKTISLY